MTGHNSVIGGGGFHHISMHVQDMDKSVSFYEKLGFTVQFTWGPEDRRTALLDSGDGNYLEISPGESDGFNPNGLIRHLAFRTDDCDVAIAAARAAGAEITTEPKPATLWGPPTPIRVAFCKGPDGEVIEFFEDEES